MTRRNERRGVEEYPPKLDDGSEIVGVSDDGGVVYWDPVREVVLSGDHRPEEDLSEMNVRRKLGVDEDLGDVIEDIESSVGWHSLSERAQELLGTDASDG